MFSPLSNNFPIITAAMIPKIIIIVSICYFSHLIPNASAVFLATTPGDMTESFAAFWNFLTASAVLVVNMPVTLQGNPWEQSVLSHPHL